MWETRYVIWFMTSNGVWTELPATESPSVAGEIVQTLLKCTKIEGEAVKVTRIREYKGRD